MSIQFFPHLWPWWKLKEKLRGCKFWALNAYMSLPLTSTTSLVYMTKVNFSGSVCWISVSLVVGDMRQQMRMA